MSDSDAPRTPFTLDEIIAVVSDIARDPDSRDRLRALKLLTSLNSSVAAIPPRSATMKWSNDSPA